MAPSNPTTWQQYFDMVDKEAEEHVFSIVWEDYIIGRIEEGRQNLSFMQGKTIDDYWAYHKAKDREELKKAREAPGPSIGDFWKAAYYFNPLERKREDPNDLVNIVDTNKLQRIPLGTLYGTQLELQPDLGALDNAYAKVHNLPLQRLAFPSAISFLQGHPSEDERLISVQSDKDALLRRFLCLGWVIKHDVNRMTGHCLVIDMDETSNKKRHPWFILAPQWDDPNVVFTAEADDLLHADQFVKQGDDDVEGIFPGTNNRTTLARLRSDALLHQNQTGPFLSYFSTKLVFEITRFGQPYDRKQRNDPRYLKGTYLPVLMDLFWNPSTQEEICYNEDRWVYFRYHRPTKSYNYDQPAYTDNFTEWLPRVTPTPTANADVHAHSLARRRRDRDRDRRLTSEA